MGAEHHYAIADLHLGHLNVLAFDKRPYPCIEQHDLDLTRNCMEAGRPNRTLWLLGDIAKNRSQLKDFMDAIRPFWMRINLIRGNHDDKVAWKLRDLFDEAHESRYLRISPEERFYLSHYAHRTWRNSHHGSYHLHGHSHGALPRWGRSMDVGANCIGYKPISFAECVDQLKDNPTVDHHHNEQGADQAGDS